AGGGVYGQAEEPPGVPDYRCAFYPHKQGCRNNEEQNGIIAELIEVLDDFGGSGDPAALLNRLRRTRIGALLEYSRSVHAEMDALLAAGRNGIPTVGARLFVTTYPCHYCARHIVAAGIHEVQYIQPYPKSRARRLHDDSLTDQPDQAITASRPGGKVLIRPFVGVAPRLYQRAFLKDRELKDPTTGALDITPPEWGSQWSLWKVSYTQFEAELSKAAQPQAHEPTDLS
ncbi:MAG: hypothetical protein K2Q10_14430, partial [Rhodospirillales bacterium]|nr:hypothetical protein [Rhodospirillales bacterium]